jgi:hypothetical protein
LIERAIDEIAGNHDFLFEENNRIARRLLASAPSSSTPASWTSTTGWRMSRSS